MQLPDMGFKKDVAEPRFVLQPVRAMLEEPLRLPAIADEFRTAALSGQRDCIWDIACSWLEIPAFVDSADPGLISAVRTDAEWHDLDAALAAALDAFLHSATRVDHILHSAWQSFSTQEIAHASATYLAGIFNAEDNPEVRTALRAIGFSPDLVTNVIAEGLAVDPEPSADRYLDVVEGIDLSLVTRAGRLAVRALYRLTDAARSVTTWPTAPKVVHTPLGAVCIGTPGDDCYAAGALLIIDPAGDDTYTGAAACAFGTRRIAAVADLAGNDRYKGTGLLGPGSAVFGVAVCLDCSGDDFYSARFAGQASAAFGVTWLEDRAGNDVYRARAASQAAGTCGIGILRDRGGDDIYDVGLCGQGYAGVRGVGILIDDKGNDRYLAGGREPDHERNPDRYLSLSQGFSIGMRPFAGGGVGALVDLDGNDTYQADVYGQGVSYWYSVGLLLDNRGNDTYSVYHYGQGCGIHLSLGLLYDGQGHDLYSGYILAQGNAHDFAVGMLFDQAGNDTYTADHHSQGRAINNSLALLLDSGGNDAYFGRLPDRCQGIGDDGSRREYGSLALLLDLGGRDRYNCGATNAAAMLRPDHGVVYDLGEK